MDTPAHVAADSETSSEWIELRGGAAHLSAGVWAGLLSGLIIGGLGGRLAMGILRLTSDPSLHGRATDDGFKIGIVSGSMIFLVGICTVLGLMGGLVYLAVRGWLPESNRGAWAALVAGAIGSALVIKPEGIDFTLVEPIYLSIPMFIVIPAFYGWALSAWTERFLRRKTSSLGAGAAFIPLLGLALIGPFGIIAVALGFVTWLVMRRVPSVASLWNSRWVTAIGRTLLAGVTVVSLVALTSDIIEIV